MSQFEPIEVSESIVAAVERYLRSNFKPRRESVALDYAKAIIASKENREIGGALFREIRREFKKGKSLEEMIGKGLLNSDLIKFTDHSLYEHQSKALEYASNQGRNIIRFMYPINLLVQDTSPYRLSSCIRIRWRDL